MSNRTFYTLLGSFGGLIVVSIIIAFVIILRSSAVAGQVRSSPAVSDATHVSSTPERVPVYGFYSQLDGRAVSTSADVSTPIVTVMIDNHPDARPQAGISQARVVYEVPVEGAFTRYMAVFSEHDDVSRIGPVRSARPYFIDLAREYGNPWYFHSGGSPDALTLLKSGVVRDGNEFFLGQYFVRDAHKDAPHNLFTSSSAWNALETTISATGNNLSWDGWRFMRYGDDEEYASLTLSASPSSSEMNAAVAIRYAANYTVGWKYDALKEKYYRLIQGVPSVDESLQPILANTILIQQATVKSIDSDDRKSIALIGSGKGTVVSRGQLVHATWKKAAPTDRTRWYDSHGNELVFVPGTVWVEVVSPSVAVTFSN